VEEAQRAINSAHVEAESVHNGIGLVKLMGRYSGEISVSMSADVSGTLCRTRCIFRVGMASRS
jgi:6-phosphofructokinase